MRHAARNPVGARFVPRLGAIALCGLLAACGAARPEPLAPDAVAALDEVYQEHVTFVLLEMVRPAGQRDRREEIKQATRRLQAALSASLSVSGAHAAHYEVARNLGMVFATGTSLGWPAAPQLAERFLQEALRLDGERVDALLLLGMLHVIEGDTAGGIDYLERARDKSPLSPAPNLLIALATSYYQSGRGADAEATLHTLLATYPDHPLGPALLEVVQQPDASGSILRVPTTFTPEPHRSDATVAALDFPLVEYRNMRHGFAVSYPFDWIPWDEEVEFPLGPCRRLAELTLELPWSAATGAATLGRLRLLSYPVGFGVSSRAFSEDRLPLYRYPDSLQEVAAVLEDSIHLRYAELANGDDEVVGELVFVVRGQMGFFFHLVSTRHDIEAHREAFHAFLRRFRALPPARFAPQGCVEERPA